MCERGWWHGEGWWRHGVIPLWEAWGAQPQTGLQADGHTPPARLLGPNGHPAPRRVHRIGFQAAMVIEED